MSDQHHAGEETEQFEEDVDEKTCAEQHVADLADSTKRFMSVFMTIQNKTEDLARAESDIKRFELSIEADRKRLQKTLEGAKLGLRQARIQMGAELAKLDVAGFSKMAQLLKDENNA